MARLRKVSFEQMQRRSPSYRGVSIHTVLGLTPSSTATAVMPPITMQADMPLPHDGRTFEPATEQSLRRYMARVGYVYGQDMAAGFDFKTAEKDANQIRAAFSRLPTPDEIVRFSEALRQSPVAGRIWWSPTDGNGARFVVDASKLTGDEVHSGDQLAELRRLTIELMERELPGDLEVEWDHSGRCHVIQDTEGIYGPRHEELLQEDAGEEPDLLARLGSSRAGLEGLRARYLTAEPDENHEGVAAAAKEGTRMARVRPVSFEEMERLHPGSMTSVDFLLGPPTSDVERPLFKAYQTSEDPVVRERWEAREREGVALVSDRTRGRNVIEEAFHSVGCHYGECKVSVLFGARYKGLSLSTLVLSKPAPDPRSSPWPPSVDVVQKIAACIGYVLEREWVLGSVSVPAGAEAPWK